MDTSELLRSDSASLSEFEIIDDNGILSESDNGGFPSRKSSVSDKNEKEIVHGLLIENVTVTDQRQHLSKDEELHKESLDSESVSPGGISSVLVLENFQTIDDNGKLNIDTTSLRNFLKTCEEPNTEKMLVMANWIDKLHIENKELQIIIDTQSAQGDGQVKKMSRSASVVSVASTCWGVPDMEAFRNQQPYIEKMELHSCLVREAEQEELRELEGSGQMTDKIRLDLHNVKYRFRYQLEDWNMFDRVQFEEDRAESKKKRLSTNTRDRSPWQVRRPYNYNYGNERPTERRSPSHMNRHFNSREEYDTNARARSSLPLYRSTNDRYESARKARSSLSDYRSNNNRYESERQADTRPSSPDCDSYNHRYETAPRNEERPRSPPYRPYPNLRENDGHSQQTLPARQDVDIYLRESARGQRWIVSRDYSHTNDRRCVYCGSRHEHDQCPNTVSFIERLCHLVSSGKCTICLKTRCNCSGDPYRCKYCRNFTDGLHHESLCPYVRNVFSNGYHN
ncbi:Protein CBG27397 [Caenorhabditis briggsae]|uniref:Protein CBG27397 n=1 Tax=Caenorhabditis briggsae TaxID=6238 RepID=B6IJX4_CAEBR|nr:Protein CBG27397 [Caenorhabditis briggsae]CAS00204.1 Protein CBG27397 [Caenorhabditis briggsae]